MVEKNNKKKVLHVTIRMGYGGIETWISALITHYDHDRYQMDLCLIGKKGEPGELIDHIRNADSLVFIIPLKNPYKFWGIFEHLANGYDLIIIHTGIYLAPFILFRSWNNYKQSRLFMVHNTRDNLPFRLFGLEQKPIVLNITKRIFNLFNAISSTRILGCSYAAIHSNFGPLGKRKSEVISYGIDIEKFSPISESSDLRNKFNIPEDALVIGNIGRFSFQKNHKMFINVASAMIEKNIKYFFILVGDGELHNEIVDQIHELGVDNYFLLTGFTNDVNLYLSVMDLVFFPSRYEGFPVSILEAQAQGIPVVTGRQPELKEVICPNNHDWCLADTNDIFDCVSRIELILSDKETYTQIRTSGISWVQQNYAIQKSLTSLENVIQRY